jgi:hypothetical protein
MCGFSLCAQLLGTKNISSAPVIDCAAENKIVGFVDVLDLAGYMLDIMREKGVGHAAEDLFKHQTLREVCKGNESGKWVWGLFSLLFFLLFSFSVVFVGFVPLQQCDLASYQDVFAVGIPLLCACVFFFFLSFFLLYTTFGKQFTPV